MAMMFYRLRSKNHDQQVLAEIDDKETAYRAAVIHNCTIEWCQRHYHQT